MMRGAIFDMDGLMFDSERVYLSFWMEGQAYFGLTPDPALHRKICGTSGDHMLALISQVYPDLDAAAFRNYVFARCEEEPDRFCSEKPGLRTLLPGLKALGFRLAVASSSSPERIRYNLKTAGISDFFDVVVSGTQAAHSKPAPDIFLMAADLLGLTPSECYVLEDSINGVRAGIASGSRTLMIPDLQTPAEDLKAHAVILPDLTAALSWIESDYLNP